MLATATAVAEEAPVEEAIPPKLPGGDAVSELRAKDSAETSAEAAEEGVLPPDDPPAPEDGEAAALESEALIAAAAAMPAAPPRHDSAFPKAARVSGSGPMAGRAPRPPPLSPDGVTEAMGVGRALLLALLPAAPPPIASVRSEDGRALGGSLIPGRPPAGTTEPVPPGAASSPVKRGTSVDAEPDTPAAVALLSGLPCWGLVEEAAASATAASAALIRTGLPMQALISARDSRSSRPSSRPLKAVLVAASAAERPTLGPACAGSPIWVPMASPALPLPPPLSMRPPNAPPPRW